MAKTRQTNFSQEESSIILTEFENEMEYLNSGFSNQVTNKGKKTRWDEIAKKVNATLTYDLEDQVILDPATAFSFEDYLNNWSWSH